jgi:glycosyltransferase involved in cell wall biosynthesis
MKVAWFTPLSRRTGISKYSVSAIHALSKKIDIHVWTVGESDNLKIDGVPVHEIVLSDEIVTKLSGYDVIIYNLGNNIDFHFEIFQCYKKVKGIVILHDRVMHHFTAGYYLDKVKKPDRYVSMMKYYYGDEGGKAAERSLRYPPPVWETEEVVRYPLLNNIISNSYGIVVHSGSLLERLRRMSPVPSEYIFHPFYQYPEGSIHLSRKDLKLPSNKIILLQYGHITPSKNIHKVIEAISESPEIRDQIHYIVAGDSNSPYGVEIKKLIKENKLQDVVSLTGYLTDDVLHSYINAADICINLRFPSTEGGSGSLIEQLYFKKPVIATRIGFFAEVPDECIVKLEPPIDVNELSAAIQRLVKDKELRDRMTFNGARFAHKNFSPHLYAKNFMDFIDKVLSYKTAIDFIDNVTDEISSFVSPSTSEYFIDNIAREMSGISVLYDTGHERNKEEFQYTDENRSYGHAAQYGPGDGSSELPEPLMDRFVNFGWRHRERIKKIPLLGSISRKIYHSISRLNV